jgi:hypothetical protein
LAIDRGRLMGDPFTGESSALMVAGKAQRVLSGRKLKMECRSVSCAMRWRILRKIVLIDRMLIPVSRAVSDADISRAKQRTTSRNLHSLSRARR